MKVLVVTSQVTFVPENYDRLITGLAALPQVGGLLVLNNLRRSLLGKGFGLMALGAPATGLQLIKNGIGKSNQRRVSAFTRYGKPTWFLNTVNSEEALAIVRQNDFDLILNARTRFIYKAPILSAPRLGCINIHHGLLPEQRGTMCDLWALYEGKPAGFSIHRMSEKIDDGDIITVQQVDPGSGRNYSDYLLKASEVELDTVAKVLSRIELTQVIESRANITTLKLPHYRNPQFAEIRDMKRKGLIL